MKDEIRPDARVVVTDPSRRARAREVRDDGTARNKFFLESRREARRRIASRVVAARADLPSDNRTDGVLGDGFL